MWIMIFNTFRFVFIVQRFYKWSFVFEPIQYLQHGLSVNVHKYWQAQTNPPLSLSHITHTLIPTQTLHWGLISVLGGREKLLIIRLMGTRLSSASLSPNCLCKYLCLCVCVSEDGGTSGYHTDNKGMGVEERVYSQHICT